MVLQRTVGKFRGVAAPSFITLMDSVAMLQRKPVRARCGCHLAGSDFHMLSLATLHCTPPVD